MLRKLMPELLKAIQRKIEQSMSKISVQHIIDLATIFARHLTIPNFLFKELINKIDDIQINQQNKLRIRRLVDILCIRLKKSYTYSSFMHQEIEYNCKWTRDSIQLLQVLLAKFRDSNLISFHLLSSHILENQDLSLKILPTSGLRRVHVTFLLKQLSQYLATFPLVTVQGSGVAQTTEITPIFKFLPMLKILSYTLEAENPQRSPNSILNFK